MDEGDCFARLSRRAFLAALAAGASAGRVRAAPAADPVATILARSGLGACSGFVLADLGSGRLLEAHRADVGQPPGSVIKILTALYALDTLGPDYRFESRVLATGPVEAGIVRGDLVLAGAGDPVLDTDALGGLVAALAAHGVRGASGRFLVATGALPALGEIEPDQPAEAGYNPAISGMNLNFNRVLLEWAPGEGGARLAFSAPGEHFTAPVASIRAVPGDGLPRHWLDGGREVWSLPAAGLGGTGSQWLPVRVPGAYAGEVFAALAAQAGVVLPPAMVVAAAPPGVVVAGATSPGLGRMMREMLYYSTNLTAEVAGLRAGQRRGPAPLTLGASGAAMAAWARGRYGLESDIVNHSGLTDRSRLTPAGLLGVLAAERERLPGLLRERPILDAARKPLATDGVRLVCKTGTLNFATGLAGYLQASGGRTLGFAIFAADMDERARIAGDLRENPPGAVAWEKRARDQEQALLRRWLGLYVA